MQAIHEVLQQAHEVVFKVVVSGVVISAVCRVSVEEVREFFHRHGKKPRQ